jgi:hypothetical protein
MRNDRWFSRACPWSSPLANWEAPAPCRRSHAGAVFHRHLAPPCRRKSQTCLLSCPGDAPSGSRTVVAARVAGACGADGPPADRASFSIISTRQKLMPRSNRLDQRGNAETYRNAPPYSRFDLCSRRIRGRWISLFMALLSSGGQSNPGLHAQGEQRRSSYCDNDRDIALSQSETFKSFKFCNKLLQFVCCRNQAFRIQSL